MWETTNSNPLGTIKLSTQSETGGCKNISHIQDFITNFFFPTPPIKLELHICERLLIATHLEQSNYLPNQKQEGAVFESAYWTAPWLWKGSKSCSFRAPAVFQRIPLDLTDQPHDSGFPLVGSHTLSVGGDGLTSVLVGSWCAMTKCCNRVFFFFLCNEIFKAHSKVTGKCFKNYVNFVKLTKN
jgi:hypothetical protein